MTGNTIGWVAFSYLVKDWFIFVANSPGVLISLYLNAGAMKLEYLESLQREGAKEIKQESQGNDYDTVDVDDITDTVIGDSITDDETKTLTTIGKIDSSKTEKRLSYMIALWICVFTYCALISPLYHDSQEHNILLVGVVVNCNLVFFFGAPLSSIQTVIRTKSSSSIHKKTMIMNLLCSGFWMSYGIAQRDSFVVLPNILGFLLGIVLLLLYCLYKSSNGVEYMETNISSSCSGSSVELTIT